MTTNEKMLRLFKELKREMNGAVVGAMRNFGLDYHLNYGVSVPTIRRVAERFYPDHSLAMLLIRQDVRELKIGAIYIDDPTALNRVAMQEWSGVFMTPELVELSCTHLLSRSPEAQTMALQWISDERPLFVKAALVIAGRLAQRQELGSEAAMQILTRIETYAHTPATFLTGSLIYALREIGRMNSGMHQQALLLVDALSQSESSSAREIAEEVRWQLQEPIH